MTVSGMSIKKIRSWRESPVQMVRDLFDVEPDLWQAEVLNTLTVSSKVAARTCKGAGATTVLAWAGINFLLTRNNPKIVAIGPSSDMMRDNFWADVLKWRDKSPLLVELFGVRGQRLFLNEHPESWWLRVGKFSLFGDKTRQASALAGVISDHVLFLIDGAGEMPEDVLASAEASFMPGVECHIVAVGSPGERPNPEKRVPPSVLWRADHDSSWWTCGVPATRAPRVRKEWAEQLVEDYGAEAPFVRRNVFADYPLSP